VGLKKGVINMGYTRYWSRTNKKVDTDLVEAVNEILDDCKAKGIIIKNGIGVREPIVEVGRIVFNGNDETELSHETFYITNNDVDSEFEFCKTARKPYDYAVREVLKVAEELGYVYNVSDDGENEAIISDEEWLTTGWHE
jgi:hypothetical protein